MTANRPSTWWRVIDWRTVAAAGVPAWLLVLGVVVWGKTQSRSGPGPLPGDPPSVALASVETAPMARFSVEVSPMPRALREVAGLPREVTELAPAPRAAVDPAPVVELFAALLQNLAHPPRPVAKVAAKPVPEGCKTHGTAVHFTKSTLEAMKQAKAKDKLVFVLHLSGNIEDDGFT